MSRAFLIGGFGASQEMLDPVGEALSNHFEEVDTMTLRYAEGSPDAVEIMAREAELFALSGAIGVTKHARPIALHGLDAAVKRSATGLIFRTGLKQGRMHMDDHQKAKEFEAGCRREIFDDLGFHIGELYRIAQMDAVAIGARHYALGAQANLAYFDRSAYFGLSSKDEVRAREAGVRTFKMQGQHDEPLLRPDATIAAYLELAG